MKTPKKFIALFLFFIGWNASMAQTYHIKSFDGKVVEVKLNYKLFSKKLALSCSNDTLYLLDYTGTRNVRIFAKRFLQIEYDVLGGTGIVNRNTVIISVNKDKIITSMLLNSRFEGISTDRYILHEVRLKSEVDIDNNYQIQAYISDQVKSKNHPIEMNKREKIVLKFDNNHKVFYSRFENLSKDFVIFKPDDSGEVTKQFVKGRIPEMLLGEKYIYLYINDCWYSRGIQHTGLIPDSLASNSYRRIN